MFEPQDHPDDIPYPGGAPTPPYDSTGYTLAFQMGVQFDRILEDFDGPFEKLTDVAKAPAGTDHERADAGRLLLQPSGERQLHRLNRLLKAGEEVSWLQNGPLGRGTFYVAAKPSTRAILEKAAADLGVGFEAARDGAGGTAAQLRAPRIALFDTYGNNNMPSGWTRLVLENFEFPYDRVFPPDIDKGGLRAKYDVIVFNGAGLQRWRRGGRGGRGGGDQLVRAGRRRARRRARAGAGRGGAGGRAAAAGRAGFTPQPIPEEFARRQGQVSAQTLAQVEAVREGGRHARRDRRRGDGRGAAVRPAGHQSPGRERHRLSREKYYVPGAVLRVAVDDTHPLAHGLDKELDVFFDNDPGVQAGRPTPRPRACAASPGSPTASRCAAGGRGGRTTWRMAPGSSRHASEGPASSRSRPESCSARSRTAAYKLFFNGLYLSVAPELLRGDQGSR